MTTKGVLTEKTVLSKTRVDGLSSVRNLNLWGNNISDVSILKDMENVEVLSLSVNKISSLRDFARCPNLKELYLRKNDVRQLSEVRHLINLPELRVLWLCDNPCAENSLYRPAIIKALPQLQKLDNTDVTEEERAAAYSMSLPAELDIRSLAAAEAAGARPITPPPASLPAEDRSRKGHRECSDTEWREYSSNILYAVMALLHELDFESLNIVKAEIEQKLSKS
eukprot:jgi/Mesvir1/14399/Mv09785-RA.1